MKREVDVQKMQTVEEYANAQEDILTYVKGIGYVVNGNTMSCPFHGSDSTPSLKINGNKWKCFGCGRGGGYLKFRHENDMLENHKKTYYDVIEDYIKEHGDLAAIVGGTIFKSKEETFTEQWENMLSVAEGKHYKPKKVDVKSVDKLIRRVRHMDNDVKIRLLSGIQDDLPYAVLESIVNGSDITGKSLLDLSFG